MDDVLVVETRVSPAERGALQTGQKAVVKVAAYDYTTFGTLQGQVSEISADSLVDERGERYFRVGVAVDPASLRQFGQPVRALREREQVVFAALPLGQVTDARLVDGHTERSDLSHQPVGRMSAQGVKHQLLVLLGVDLHAAAELEVVHVQPARAVRPGDQQDGVGGSELALDTDGRAVLDALLDQQLHAGHCVDRPRHTQQVDYFYYEHDIRAREIPAGVRRAG